MLSLPSGPRPRGGPRPPVSRRGGRVVMQRPAKPCTPVRFRPPPPTPMNGSTGGRFPSFSLLTLERLTSSGEASPTPRSGSAAGAAGAAPERGAATCSWRAGRGARIAAQGFAASLSPVHAPDLVEHPQALAGLSTWRRSPCPSLPGTLPGRLRFVSACRSVPTSSRTRARARSRSA